jgi:hypothetical protein
MRPASAPVPVPVPVPVLGQKAARQLRVAMSRSHPSAELAVWLAPWGAVEARGVGNSLMFCLVTEGPVEAFPPARANLRLGHGCWPRLGGGRGRAGLPDGRFSRALR